MATEMHCFELPINNLSNIILWYAVLTIKKGLKNILVKPTFTLLLKERWSSCNKTIKSFEHLKEIQWARQKSQMSTLLIDAWCWFKWASAQKERMRGSQSLKNPVNIREGEFTCSHWISVETQDVSEVSVQSIVSLESFRSCGRCFFARWEAVSGYSNSHLALTVTQCCFYSP